MVKLTDESAYIYEVQCALRQRSSMNESIRPRVIPDGIYGQQTRAAVASFQKGMGLPETGVIDYRSWQALFAEDVNNL